MEDELKEMCWDLKDEKKRNLTDDEKNEWQEKIFEKYADNIPSKRMLTKHGKKFTASKNQ